MAGAAYERSWALLRATVPSSDWRWQVERDKRGRFQRRIYTHLEFTSQSGQRYQVWFASTAINIKAVGTEGHFMFALCGGPKPFSYTGGRLPDPDIWLGQYLALKYDERAFRKKAVPYAHWPHHVVVL